MYEDVRDVDTFSGVSKIKAEEYCAHEEDSTRVQRDQEAEALNYISDLALDKTFHSLVPSFPPRMAEL